MYQLQHRNNAQKLAQEALMTEVQLNLELKLKPIANKFATRTETKVILVLILP